MCLAPTLIPNPNLGRKDRMSYLVDTRSQFIPVPCGHCPQCVAARQSSIVQRLQAEELGNHLFFCTLTYNDESIPVLTTSTGYEIRYAARRDFTLMVKRLRKSNAFGRPFRFICVSELGEKRGRPHFHCIWILPKYSRDRYPEIMQLESKLFDAVLHEWRRNYGSTRKPVYKPLCTYVRRFVRGRLSSNYDLHYMNPASTDKGNTDVAFYVTKYMFKPSDRETRLQQALKLNLPPDEYDDIWKVVKPGFVSSPNLGLGDEKAIGYVRSCIDRSKDGELYPKFYNPVDGSQFPLSRYYIRKGIYNVDDATHFYFKNPRPVDELPIDETPLDVKLRKFDKFGKQLQVLEHNDEASALFDELIK